MAAPGETDDEILAQEIERLNADYAQEMQMMEMLEQSAADLSKTIEELEGKIENISDESNEWKTRFETQKEVNDQLQKQIILLQDKVDLARKAAKDMQTRTPAEIFSKVDFADVSRWENLEQESTPSRNPQYVQYVAFNPNKVSSQTLKIMEKEKQSLQNQLRGIEWRTDQESKAYHKANEERKQYHSEIAITKQVLNTLEQQGARILHGGRPTKYQPGDYNSPRNIPPDQRIIDPKHGPIKKTAAVKNLPSLQATAD